MNCLNCSKPMKEVRREITSTNITDGELIEYYKATYECRNDDIWVTTEIPHIVTHAVALSN